MPLSNPQAFFESLRNGFMGSLNQAQVNGCNTILSAMDGDPLADCAYALATAYHETGHTMQPIKEYGGNAYYTKLYDVEGDNPDRAQQMGNTEPGDGAKYCGRGLVQLTWKNNYQKAGDAIGVDLVSDPDLALDPTNAAKILRNGMDQGWFSGRAFSNYLPTDGSAATHDQFVQARRIINGQDRADLIAGYADGFQDALQEGGWE